MQVTDPDTTMATMTSPPSSPSPPSPPSSKDTSKSRQRIQVLKYGRDEDREEQQQQHQVHYRICNELFSFTSPSMDSRRNPPYRPQQLPHRRRRPLFTSRYSLFSAVILLILLSSLSKANSENFSQGRLLSKHHDERNSPVFEQHQEPSPTPMTTTVTSASTKAIPAGEVVPENSPVANDESNVTVMSDLGGVAFSASGYDDGDDEDEGEADEDNDGVIPYNPDEEPALDCDNYGDILPECQPTTSPSSLTAGMEGDATLSPEDEPALRPDYPTVTPYPAVPTYAPETMPSSNIRTTVGPSQSPTMAIMDDGEDDDGDTATDNNLIPPPRNHITQKLSVAITNSRHNLGKQQKKFFYKMAKHTTTQILDDHSPFRVFLNQEDGSSSSSSSSSDDGGGGGGGGGGGRRSDSSDDGRGNGGSGDSNQNGQGGGKRRNTKSSRGNGHRVITERQRPSSQDERHLQQTFQKYLPHMYDQVNSNNDPDTPISTRDVSLGVSHPTISIRRLQNDNQNTDTEVIEEKLSMLKHYRSHIRPLFDIEAERWWDDENSDRRRDGHKNMTQYSWYAIDVEYTVYWMNGNSLENSQYLGNITHVCQAVLDFTLKDGLYLDEWHNQHQTFREQDDDGFAAIRDNRTQEIHKAVKILGVSKARDEMRAMDELGRPPKRRGSSSGSSSSSDDSSSSDSKDKSGRCFIFQLDASSTWTSREWFGMGMLITTVVLAVSLSLIASVLQKRHLYEQTWSPYLTEDGLGEVLDVGWRYQHGQGYHHGGDGGDADGGVAATNDAGNNHAPGQQPQENDNQFYLQIYDKHNVGYNEENSVLQGGPHLVHAAVGEEKDAGLAPTDPPSSSASSSGNRAQPTGRDKHEVDRRYDVARRTIQSAARET